MADRNFVQWLRDMLAPKPSPEAQAMEETLREIAASNLETLSRVEAARKLDEEQHRREEIERIRLEARAASHEAATWLATHPKTHSARKGDVKRLLRAVDNLDLLLDDKDA